MDMELESLRRISASTEETCPGQRTQASGGFYLLSFCWTRKNCFYVCPGLVFGPLVSLDGFGGAVRDMIWLTSVKDLSAGDAVMAELLAPVLYHEVLTSVLFDPGDSVRKNTWISG